MPEVTRVERGASRPRSPAASGGPPVLCLTEHRTRDLAARALSLAAAERLWRDHADQVSLDPPSHRNRHRWVLRAGGWVGSLPVGDELLLRFEPKVPVGNLFRMLEYAYDLGAFRWLEGSVPAASLDDLFERLIQLLADRVRDRVRRGLHRAYLPRRDRLSHVRGRLDLPALLRRPGHLLLDCHFQEQTADLEDNRILAWTLHRMVHCVACRRPEVRAAAAAALRALRGGVTLEPYSAEACVGRVYHRLNDDYRPLHALCRFLLDGSGPGLGTGDRGSLPFLVSMHRLFEEFVHRWLAAHLPPGLEVQSQRQLPVRGVSFIPDLVVEDRAAGRPFLVIDTKYKAPSAPAAADVAQVVAYATGLGVRDAVLLYPSPLDRPLDTAVGEVRVRSATFALEGDLDAQGGEALRDLLRVRRPAGP